MTRKLKTYLTSVGFFDLAIAAPSMKAALAAWGSNSNLFHQGFANEVTDGSVVEATMAQPGVVLRRPVGSNKPFKVDAAFSADLPDKRTEKPSRRQRNERPPPPKMDQKAASKAASVYEREQKKREAARRKEEAAQEVARQRRDKGVAKAQAALDEAERDHTKKLDAIETERAKLDASAEAEDARWQERKSKLMQALRRARS
jgi:hypothetical protein